MKTEAYYVLSFSVYALLYKKTYSGKIFRLSTAIKKLIGKYCTFKTMTKNCIKEILRYWSYGLKFKSHKVCAVGCS